jgi:hypothetical protein
MYAALWGTLTEAQLFSRVCCKPFVEQRMTANSCIDENASLKFADPHAGATGSTTV